MEVSFKQNLQPKFVSTTLSAPSNTLDSEIADMSSMPNGGENGAIMSILTSHLSFLLIWRPVRSILHVFHPTMIIIPSLQRSLTSLYLIHISRFDLTFSPSSTISQFLSKFGTFLLRNTILISLFWDMWREEMSRKILICMKMLMTQT